MSVIVYSKPNCIQCIATKRVLDAQGTDYKNIDLSADKKRARDSDPTWLSRSTCGGS
ncbi:glutaredoxin family protein [Photobacterium phosphoreum]|uniref:glutaredoxin family protein n=1 Tax=Photobacterium phosphoreum TaxID=659 RepID=UPI000B1DF3CD